MRALLRFIVGACYGAVVGALIGPRGGMVLGYIVGGLASLVIHGEVPLGLRGVVWIGAAASLGLIAASPWGRIARASLIVGAAVSAAVAIAYVLILSGRTLNPDPASSIPSWLPLLLLCPTASGAAACAVAAMRQDSIMAVLLFEPPS